MNINCRLRRWRLLCLFVFLISTLMVYGLDETAAKELDPVYVYVDNTRVHFSIEPMLEQGTTLVQLRPLFESLGITLEWDGAKRIVNGKKTGMTFALHIDSDEAVLNGKKVQLTKAARIVDGHTMVPLRFIGEATGALVHWDQQYREIVIITEELLNSYGLTKEEATQLLNEPDANGVQASDKDALALKSMYYSMSLDIANTCGGGFCFQYYTFFPDGKIYVGEPQNGGVETMDCTSLPCSTYTIGEGFIVFDQSIQLSFGVTEDGRLVLDGKELIPVRPLKEEFMRNRLYETISTYGSTLGNAMIGGYILLQEDGSYKAGKLIMGTDFNYTLEQGGYASDSSESGLYEIKGNTIIFTHESGEKSSLFIMDISEDGSGLYADRRKIV